MWGRQLEVGELKPAVVWRIVGGRGLKIDGRENGFRFGRSRGGEVGIKAL
ncbi:hypothetical protein GCM10011579_020420 [Streptomyces albiflavescens]|uniref:Uncharacterized protein n=1 Tax=Streptomyces albiflavescens TaxID=1623582 RepID=A0A918D1Y1_9ACTN|nr:hypothetical protein GCM10011579_020420 [Streptomyces albiflavescens]